MRPEKRTSRIGARKGKQSVKYATTARIMSRSKTGNKICSKLMTGNQYRTTCNWKNKEDRNKIVLFNCIDLLIFPMHFPIE